MWNALPDPGSNSFITVASFDERDELSTIAAPIGTVVRIAAQTQYWKRTAQSSWEVVENPVPTQSVQTAADLPAVFPTGGVVEVQKPEAAAAVDCCASKFSITPKSCDPENPNAGCQFDVELDLNIPIPVPPCPVLNVKSFSVGTVSPGTTDCPECLVIEVPTCEARDWLTLEEAPVGSTAHVADGCGVNKPYWQRQASGAWDEITAPPCQSRFVITTSHKPPEDCNDTGECQFDIELDIKVPIPCPQIIGDEKVNIAAGYADTPCVTCKSDLTVADYTELGGIAAEDLKPGMYVAVQDFITTYTLNEDFVTWTPGEPVRLVYSAAELDAIPPGERAGLRVALANPTHLFRKTLNGWAPVTVPVVDIDVESAAELYALTKDAAPIGTVARVEVGNQVLRRKSHDLGASSWELVDNPVPSQTVATEPDLPETAIAGAVVKVQNPTSHYVWRGGKWAPDDILVSATVFDEQDLKNAADKLPENGFVPGIIVGVLWPTDRYRLDPETMTWVPARCPRVELGVISSKIPSEDCNTPPQCRFDLGLELAVPVPKPPCPEINIDQFEVTVGFVGGEVNDPDENCIECIPDFTEPTYDSAKTLVIEQPAGTIVKIETPTPAYSWTGAEWQATAEEEIVSIVVPNDATLAELEINETYAGVEITAGTRATVTTPTTLFRLEEDLQTWTPVADVSNGPAKKQISLETLAAAESIPFGQRYAGLYVKIAAPVTEYVMGAGGDWLPAQPVTTLDIVDEIARDALDTAALEIGTIVNLRRPAEALVSDGGEKFHTTSCPKKNQFTISKKTIPGENCDEADTCVFDVGLELAIPIPRIPCPIININQFNVSTHFERDKKDEDENCDCVLPNFNEPILEVANIAARDALTLAAAPIGTYVKTIEPEDVFWLRKTAAVWELSQDPAAPICTNLFRIRPKHRTPENCEDPGQCEFDIDLVIDVPIPRIPCPIITANVTLTSGYNDSPCVNCLADITVQTQPQLANIPNPPPGMYARVEIVVTKYRWDGIAWQDAETLNTITGETEEVGPGLGGAVRFISVDTVADLPAADVVTDTVAEILDYADRYKYEADWQPAPCPKNSFRVITKHRPPEDCNDPGQCEFDLDLNLVVPIPRVPCPEINVKTFSVTTSNADNIDCVVDVTVDTFDDLANVPAPVDGMLARVTDENAIYAYDDNTATWNKDVNRTNCCADSVFKITTRHEKCGPVLTVPTIAARDVLEIPDDVKEGEIVEVLGPPKTHWRAGNGFTTALWTAVPVDECCKDGGEKCVFDIELAIKVPQPPCPEFVGTVRTNVGYEDTFCVNCAAHITVLNKAALPNVPVLPPDFKGTYYYAKVQQAVNQFIHNFTGWTDAGTVDVITNQQITAAPIPATAFVATEEELDNVRGRTTLGDVVEVLFPTDRYRKNIKTAGPWEPAPCGKTRIVAKKAIGTCDAPGQCVLGFELGIDVVLPQPPCPEFVPSIRAHAVYSKNGELCERCPTDCTFTTLAALTRTTGTAGATAYVEQNKTKYMWLPNLGGWAPTGCQSSFIIAKRPPAPADPDCDKPKECIFDIILDIVVPIPQPPCPEFNVRSSNFSVGCGSEVPRFDVGISKRAKTDCGKDEDEQADKPCVFDFDFNLELPCPKLFGGPVFVRAVPPQAFNGGQAGWLTVLNGCQPVAPQVPCPAPNHVVADIEGRDRKLIQTIRAALAPRLQKNVTTANVINAPPGPTNPCAVAGNYTYGGGAEYGAPVWSPSGSASASAKYTVNTAAELTQLAIDIAADVDNTLIGQIFQTADPAPHGTYWAYTGGLVNGAPGWDKVFCDAVPQTNCEFSFGAAINVPFCIPELVEDDDAGTHTGVSKADRSKIFYLKPYEQCPENVPCPPPDHQVANLAALNDLLGEGPDDVRGIDQDGVEQPAVPIVPGAPTVFKVGNKYYRVPLNLIPDGAGGQIPSLPVTFEEIICEVPDPVFNFNIPCPDTFISIPALPALNKRGRLSHPQAFAGWRVRVGANGPIYKLQVQVPAAGSRVDPVFNPGFFVNDNCAGSGSRLITVRDAINPCKIWYALQIIICMPQIDHIAACTQYFGNSCFDATGCPCEASPCCYEPLKAAVEDGSQGSGIPPFYRPDIAPFTAAPEAATANIDAADMQTVVLPRLAQQVDPPAAAWEDPCKIAATAAGAVVADVAERDSKDKGYRPYKFLELNVTETYPPDRRSPPTVQYNLEAAMNCLQGGKVTVKKGTAPVPPSPAPFSMPPESTASAVDRPRMESTDPDTIGEGTIWIAQNRVNLDITLYTTECSSSSGSGGSGSGGSGSGGSGSGGSGSGGSGSGGSGSASFTALPGMFETKTTTAETQKTLTPALLAELISAINTNPELKAAIRNIVNQPD